MSNNALDILTALANGEGVGRPGGELVLVVEKSDRDSDFVGLSKDDGYVDVMDHNAGVWRLRATYLGTGEAGIREASKPAARARLAWRSRR